MTGTARSGSAQNAARFCQPIIAAAPPVLRREIIAERHIERVSVNTRA